MSPKHKITTFIHLLVFSWLCINPYLVLAQERKVFDAKGLQTEWRLLKNVSPEDPRFHALLLFTNKSSDLPASGWHIYFSLRYHSSQLKSANPEFEIEHVNGDLFRLSPTSSFHGIAAGQSLAIEYTGLRSIGNFQDVPAGLFLSTDKDQDHAITLSKPVVTVHTNLPVADGGLMYHENETIKNIPMEELPGVFPTPQQYEVRKGFFFLNNSVSIQTDSQFQKEADFLKEEIAVLFGKQIISASISGKTISFSKENLPAESYHLSITTNSIVIGASDAAGIFYGIRSLQSLLPVAASSSKPTEVKISCAEVTDGPRFPIRAFMLDVSRNFQSKEQIIRILEVMSLYKMNVFHLHFSDDEGWRLEIPGLQELTEVGAVRGFPFDNDQRLQPSYGSGSLTSPSGGTGSGYYSRTDFIEILKYANARHIKVIPEIESPGHAHAAITAMKARYRKFNKEGNAAEAERYLLSDPEDQSVYLSAQGFVDNVMNVALPSTYRFMEKVIDEIQLMYKEADAPLTMIHMAGDEVPHGSWEKSPVVLNYLKQNPQLKSGNDLWQNYFAKMKMLLKDRGLSMYGWEELILGKQTADESRHVVSNEDFIKDNVLIDAWWNVGNEGMPYSMANRGYKVVLTCFDHLYFDLPAAPSFEEPGDAWIGYLDLKKVFSFVPYDYFRYTYTSMAGKRLPENYFEGKEKLRDDAKPNIMGIQGALWAENLTHPDFVEYMMLPRLMAVAERAWAKESDWESEKDDGKSKQLHEHTWSVFVNSLGKKELPRLDHHLGGFGYRIPYPGINLSADGVEMNHQFPGFEMRYTTDGTEPTLKSKLYLQPIKEKGMIKAKAFDKRGRGSLTVAIENKP